MKIKNTIMALLVSLFLVSCMEALNNAPTETPIPAITFTLVPTDTPPIPTETPDTNTPEGWQGEKDAQGNYILKEKTATGEIIVKTWGEYKSNTGESLWKGWTIDKGGSHLFDWINTMDGYERDLVYNEVLCSDSIARCDLIPTLIHTEKTPEQMNDVDLGSKAIASIYKRLNNGQEIPDGISADTLSRAMQTGIIEVPFFVDNKSKMMVFKPSPDHGVMTILTSWIESEPSETNGYQEFYGYGNLLMRGKLLGVDSKGNIIGILSVKDLTILTNADWTAITLHFAAQIIDGADCSKQSFTDTESVWIDFALRENSGHQWIETK